MKKFLLPIIVLTSILFPGCASNPINLNLPPDAIRLETLKKSLSSPSTEAESVAKIYLDALEAEKNLKPDEACNLFIKLSKKMTFPLKDTALVHSLKNCEYDSDELESIWKNTEISNYLKESFYEASLKVAQKNKLLSYEAQFSFELTRFKKIQKEKVALLQRSIQIAQEISDPQGLLLYQNKLKEISPLCNTEITPQNIYSIAKDFETNRNFIRARDLYKQIIIGDYLFADKIKAYNAYRITYKVERDLKMFLEKTVEMEIFLKREMEQNPCVETKEAWSDSVISLARAVWTEHKNAEAKKIISDFILTNLGNGNQKATAHWLLGSLNLESKNNIEALKEFELAGKIKVTDGNLQENIQWAIVWNNYLLKFDDNVVLYADKFISKSNNLNFTAKLKYWKAKSMSRAGLTVEANQIFSNLTTSDPYGYYGIISNIDLDSSLTPLPKTIISNTTSGNPILDWLIAMEEKTYSQNYLKEINSQFKTIEQRERAMSLYALTEWYQGGMRQIYSFPESMKNSLTDKYISIVFPNPYNDLFTSFSNKYLVPKELILGITRQESAFVASERSWADAFGLMQLIPEKAIELSAKYNIPYAHYNDLYKPEINLEMGSALVRDLREKFGAKFVQSVAAYNASEDVIRVWEQERFNGNYFEFIEMIPYEETRNYIKLVFRNYIIYKRISTNTEFKIDKDFFAKPF